MMIGVRISLASQLLAAYSASSRPF